MQEALNEARAAADRGEVPVGAVVVCDGVIGVSWVGPGLLTGILEQPATSTDAANNTAIRMPSG